MSADYLAQLIALQPPGPALPRDAESVWIRLLGALAEEPGRVEKRAEDLAREADPRSTNELLTDWERVCGLPGECAPKDGVNSLQVRRAAIVAALNRLGGQSRAFFHHLAELAGVEIEITEYRPFVCGLSCCGEVLNGPEEVRFCWHIRIKGWRVIWFRCGESECGESLCAFDLAEELECLFRQAAPGHTELVVGYAEDEESTETEDQNSKTKEKA